MSGKMSVGVRIAASGPKITIRIAMTMKVSGRSSATLTIQVIYEFAFTTNQPSPEKPAISSLRFAASNRLLATWEIHRKINPLTLHHSGLCYRPVRRSRVYRYRPVTPSRLKTVTKRKAVPAISQERHTPKRAAERIRESARDLFYRQGIRAVGVDEIVSRAGVTKPSLYRSFPSKDELTADYLRHMGEEGLARFDATIAADPSTAPAELPDPPSRGSPSAAP